MGIAFLASIWTGSKIERARAFVFIAFLLLLFVGGGASRTDVLSLIYLQPAIVICLGLFWWLGDPDRVRRNPGPVLAVLTLSATIAWQLVPLPPSLWQVLPGHARYAQAASLLGQAQPWRSISIAPDWTINSLAAMLAPLAAAWGMTLLRPDQQRLMVSILIAAACLSALLGVVQVSQGTGYLYVNRSEDVADGLFANRNHHATFLACAIVLAGIWPALTIQRAREMIVRGAIAGAVAVFLFMVIVATGSRSGLLLGGLALLFATATFAQGLAAGSRGRHLISIGVPGVILAAISLMVLRGRAASLDRLLGIDLQGEQRLSAFPTLLHLVREYWLAGSGFGTFDPVFRAAEPDALLHYGYFNHAHNDAIELVLTGGLPATIVVLAFTFWWIVTSWRVFTAIGREPRLLAGRAGSMMIGLIGIASLSDYPLRTPLMAGVIVIAGCWLYMAGDLSSDRTAASIA